MNTEACTCPEGAGRDWAFTTIVCDVPEMFHPDISSGETPDESAGYGWFTKEEIAELPLHPGFKEAWEAVIRTRKNTQIGKCAVRRVDLNGQQYWEHPDPCPCRDYPVAAGGGGPEFMPHDVNNIQHGRASGSRGGGTSGHFDDGGVVNPRPGYPAAGDDGEAPQYPRGVPPSKGKIPQGYQGGFWPQGGPGTGQADTWQPVASAPRGVPPVVPGRKKAEKRFVTEAMARVMAQLSENFPPEALDWVKDAEWIGPTLVPLAKVDFHDIESWSAYHEPDRVEHFRKLIKNGEEINPPVMIKVPGHKHYRVVDGHHRTLAYLKLNRPVPAWVGKVPFGMENAALETHSSQYHQGDSKGNE